MFFLWNVTKNPRYWSYLFTRQGRNLKISWTPKSIYLSDKWQETPFSERNFWQKIGQKNKKSLRGIWTFTRPQEIRSEATHMLTKVCFPLDRKSQSYYSAKIRLYNRGKRKEIDHCQSNEQRIPEEFIFCIYHGNHISNVRVYSKNSFFSFFISTFT